MAGTRRALHFVLKVANLKSSISFFRDKLGMKVLRHEIFDKGCEAACNGPYDGKWSKTMIGYGPEDDHFVLELTYNYSIGSYKLGNDLQHIKIALGRDLLEKIGANDVSLKEDDNNLTTLVSPDGYKFLITRLQGTECKQDIVEVCLSCTNLKESSSYWADLLGMDRQDDGKNQEEALFKYAPNQASLRLRQIAEEIDHKSAYGRIAFSCPAIELRDIEKKVISSGNKVLTPYVSLDTPGKATVQVVILADPDGHEICFVGDEGFRDLSQVDPCANESIERSISEDKSDEWYKRKNIVKAEA